MTKGNKKSREIGEKYDICVDLGVKKKNVPLHCRFIFKIEEATSLQNFKFCQHIKILAKSQKGIQSPKQLNENVIFG